MEAEAMKERGTVYEGLNRMRSWAIQDGTLERFVRARHRRIGAALDVGCGNGAALALLETLGAERLAGTDLDDYLDPGIRGRVEFAAVDLNTGRLPWPDASFDVVTALQVIEHLENPFLVMREAWRVLKTGGLFVFSVPNPENLTFRVKYLLTGNMPPWTRGNDHLLFLTPDVYAKTYLRRFHEVGTVYQRGDLPLFGRLNALPFVRVPKHAKVLPRSRWFGRRVCRFLEKTLFVADPHAPGAR